MCTVFFIRELGLLSKNRDKQYQETEELVRTEDFIAVRTEGANYYSLGLNKNGCAFVSTAVNSPEWTRTIEEGELEKADEILVEENKGLSAPTKLVSDMLPGVESVQDWLDALTDPDRRWRGYNAILVDSERAVHVELREGATHVREMELRDIITNHFRKLEFGPRKREDYANSYNRFDYASEKLGAIAKLEDLQEAVHPSREPDRSRIWRDDRFMTISSTIIDLNGRALLRSEGIEQPFTEFKL